MEFEKEYYVQESLKMIDRYSIIFKKKLSLSWDKYFNFCSKRLKNSPYWLWIFLCGLEDTLKNVFDLKPNKRKLYIYESSSLRIKKITRDYYKDYDYLNSL